MTSNPKLVVVDTLDELFHKLSPEARQIISEDNNHRRMLFTLSIIMKLVFQLSLVTKTALSYGAGLS